MKIPNCSKCGSEIKIIDHKRRGILAIILSIPVSIVIFLISTGTIIPYFVFGTLVAVGVIFLAKKSRYTFWCKSCAFKTDENGNLLK